MAEHHSLFHQAINDPNHNDTADDDSDVEVTCPACDFQLNADAHFETYRICPNCQRHFWLPARERLALFVDRDSFRETNTEVISVDPVVFRDPLPLPDRMAGTRESAAAAINEALLTGIATIGGREAMVAIVDFAHLGGSIGMLAGEKITLAIEAATNRRLPFIAVCAGGGSRAQEGMLSLLQMARIANAVGRLQRKGLPFISVLTHPTIGPLYSGLACHANIILAEPGSHIGLLGDRGRGTAMPDDSAVSTAEALLQRGMLDAIVDRSVLRDRLSGLLDLILSRGTPRDSTIAAVSPTSTRRASEELTLAHHPDRPGASLYLDRLLSRFVELHGDRVGADDRTVIAGLGQIDGVSVCVIATDRQSNDGQITAAGFRKAERLHQLAASLELPVLQLIDTPGATTMGDPHSITLGMVMAQSLRGAESLPVPIVTVITGEAGGAAALSFGAADRTLMLEHAVFSLTGVDPPRGAQLAQSRATGTQLVLNARDCLRLGVVDAIVPEPVHGAHSDPATMVQNVRAAVLHAFWELTSSSSRRLLDERTRRANRYGHASPESREAIRLEVDQLQEWQRTVERSIDDLRLRIEQHQLPLPTLPHLPARPVLPSFQMPTRPNLPALHRPQVNRAEIADFAGRIAATGRGIAERVNEARSPGSDQPPHDK